MSIYHSTWSLFVYVCECVCFFLFLFVLPSLSQYVVRCNCVECIANAWIELFGEPFQCELDKNTDDWIISIVSLCALSYSITYFCGGFLFFSSSVRYCTSYFTPFRYVVYFCALLCGAGRWFDFHPTDFCLYNTLTWHSIRPNSKKKKTISIWLLKNLHNIICLNVLPENKIFSSFLLSAHILSFPAIFLFYIVFSVGFEDDL